MKTYVLHLLVVLVLAFGLSGTLVADDDSAFKLEGAWVAKVLPPYYGQWSYSISSDSSGRRASGHGSVDIGPKANFICGDVFEPVDSESPILVSMKLTGPDTISYNSIWYGLKDLGPTSPLSDQIVFIGTVTGDLEVVAPGKLHGTHNFALYTPDADIAPHDGFPDEAAAPVCEFRLETLDTRLPMPE